jgi:predicted ArsR family transcriptional regulator
VKFDGALAGPSRAALGCAAEDHSSTGTAASATVDGSTVDRATLDRATIRGGGAQPAGTVGAGDLDPRTRDRVCREVLAQGPVTAPRLAQTLGLTAAAVRRHLDALLDAGLIEVRESAPAARRGRGRPARQFVATDAGHAAMTSEYDHLAASALRFLAELAGDAAVRRFAMERVENLEQRYRPAVEAAGDDPQQRATVLAQALSDDGYAASARPLGPDGAIGTQLCQGHCPVQHVAAEFPQLCEAETAAFSRLLGVHVQRLATLAHGEHVCTTHVPTQVPTHVPTQVPQAAPAVLEVTTTQERTS